ncbi:MAG: hypothetical protein GX774_15590 [Armatimonadetes bacterium]|nr:hypothetical protein [Armatimonadota bacterium]
MDQGYVLHVVSHTHWDREWYLPFQRFRMRLVDLIDHLLALLDRDPEFRFFNLDGQTIVLEDYLQIRPENEERLRRYIGEGRILVGPWYQLNDEFLVSGEATIRSLLVGHRLAQAFGGTMKVGYLPDQFGNISQMPQILRGFGIDNAIFGRGWARNGNPVDFLWQSPDGSQVLANFMAFWYNNLQRLPEETDAAVATVKRARDLLAPLATTRHLLLMNGVDHLEAQENLSPILKAVSERLRAEGSPDEVRHSTLQQFVDALRAEAPRDQLPVVRGELRDDPGGMVLAGTLSSRMYLKQANWASQVGLEKWAEPLQAWAWMAGDYYDQGALRYAWKLLMQNHPHDSICGCSVDEVHAEMMPRFWQVQQLADELSERALHFLGERIHVGEPPAAGPAAAVVAVNPLAFEHPACLEAVVEFPLGPARRSPVAPEVDLAQGAPDVQDVQVVDPTGAIVPVQVLESTLAVRKVLSPVELPLGQSVRRLRLLVSAQSLPACGYATFHVNAAAVQPPPLETLSPSQNTLENASLRVDIGSNGCLTITDKDTGREYGGLLVFEDGGDDGDEYRYQAPRTDRVFTTLASAPQIARVEDGPVRATYRIEHLLLLPEDLSARQNEAGHTVPCRITAWVSLCADSQRVEVTTAVENAAKDHRLRVLFPTGARTEVAHAEGQFDVITRPIALPPEWIGGSPFRPQQSFVDVNDGQRGLAILNQGLPEYEVQTDTDRTIALTLLRCVGRLSGGGEAPAADLTPGAQCLGRHLFRFAIVPHSGSWEEARIWQQAHAFNVPPRCVQVEHRPGSLPASASFLQLQPANLVLSAVKRAEDEDALVLRFYNTTDTPVEAQLSLFFPVRAAYRANLNEERGEALVMDDDHRVRLPVGPKEIVTLLLER